MAAKTIKSFLLIGVLSLMMLLVLGQVIRVAQADVTTVLCYPSPLAKI